MGCHLKNEIQPLTWPEELFDKRLRLVPLYADYLEKMITMCEQNGAAVMLMIYPKTTVYRDDYAGGLEAARKHGLPFLEFTTEEKLADVGLDLKRDFYDSKHLNLLGQEKLSRYVARFIREIYVIKTHEDDDALTEKWNKAYADYMKYYQKNTADMPVKKKK